MSQEKNIYQQHLFKEKIFEEINTQINIKEITNKLYKKNISLIGIYI